MRPKPTRQNNTNAAAADDDTLSYAALCAVEGLRLRRGMVYRDGAPHSVILTSQRADAPYNDAFEADGRVLVYEGHDVPRSLVPNPKAVDQPLHTVAGTLTENGKFMAAANRYKAGQTARAVAVYEKLAQNRWRFRGMYRLVDGWQQTAGGRQVVRFRLERAAADA